MGKGTNWGKPRYSLGKKFGRYELWELDPSSDHMGSDKSRLIATFPSKPSERQIYIQIVGDHINQGRVKVLRTPEDISDDLKRERIPHAYSKPFRMILLSIEAYS